MGDGQTLLLLHPVFWLIVVVYSSFPPPSSQGRQRQKIFTQRVWAFPWFSSMYIGEMETVDWPASPLPLSLARQRRRAPRGLSVHPRTITVAWHPPPPSTACLTKAWRWVHRTRDDAVSPLLCSLCVPKKKKHAHTDKRRRALTGPGPGLSRRGCAGAWRHGRPRCGG